MDRAYRQPYQKSAAALALMVHALFFAMLYFGVNWRSEEPMGMTVDLWESLPELLSTSSEPQPLMPEPVPEEIKPPEASPPKQAEIELKDTRKAKDKQEDKKPEQKKKAEEKPRTELAKPISPKVSEISKAEKAALEEQTRMRAERAAAEAAQATANARVIDEFKAKIVGKIRRNISVVQDVPETAKAEFDVTLLPGGSVLSVRLVKPSGHEAYDSAVERAILRSQPLPLPADPSMFGKFRELHLAFRPVE